MAEPIGRARIPSDSSGELYDIVEYDDGTVSCTCAFGSRRGPMAPTSQTCKHVRAYRNSHGLGFGPDILPVALTDKDLDFDRARWVGRLCHIFSPVAYLHDLVEATLRQDNDELERLAKRNAGEGNYRPVPLPKIQRSVLERLLDTLNDLEDGGVSDADIGISEADALAATILKEALRLRQQPANTSNKAIAMQLHRKLLEPNHEN